jgi:hypothetical protein
MNRGEEIRLRALVKRLQKEATRAGARASRYYKSGGHSHDIGGTGDEGWALSFELDGEACGLEEAARKLELLIDELCEVKK